MSATPVDLGVVGAVLGGLVGAVDRLHYDRFKQMIIEAAKDEGVDPDGDAVVRAIAEIAVQETNSHVVPPGADLMVATFDERVDALVRRIRFQQNNPAPRPPLRLVP